MQHCHDINPHLLVLFTKNLLPDPPTSFIETDNPSMIYNTQAMRKGMSRERGY